MSPAIFAHLDCPMINELGSISLLTAPQKNFSAVSKFNISFYYFFLSTGCVSNGVCSKVFVMPPGVVLPWLHSGPLGNQKSSKTYFIRSGFPTFV
ncbi:hypothetical protein CDAR_429261 [Caerostris darwini]|uniref:Uncharacterized protein n=1 Tax=Caerostris darwini TaxID=1538125 RepID=A0AAV4RQQ5_9ARAC|nr:hypothetical protein CDAR_429261 [Caerostris darwini]